MAFRSSVQTNGDYDDGGDPDIIYYNASIINDNSVGQTILGSDPIVRFQETRSVPLIKDISKFYFSIVRFTMNGPNKDLPIFLPSIRTGQSDINLTNYSFGLQLTKQVLIGGNPFTFTGYAYRFVQYATESTGLLTYGLPLPNPPINNQDIRGVYYYVYTYEHWLTLVNNTLQQVLSSADPISAYKPVLSLQEQFNAFWIANGGVAPAPNIITEAPTYVYNPSSTNFTIYADTYGFGGNDAVSTGGAVGDQERMDLWLNTNSYGLFSNFENEYQGNEALGQVNRIIFKNKVGTNIMSRATPTPPVPVVGGALNYVPTKTYWVNQQEYNSTSTLWSPIESIVFTSTLIPIFPEQVGAPIAYGAGNDVVQSSSTSAFQPIITDIALPLQTAHDYREFLEYLPAAEYRLAAFTSSKQELRNIDVQVFWKARLDGNLYPIRMFNLSSVSIKMMFRKKSRGI